MHHRKLFASAALLDCSAGFVSRLPAYDGGTKRHQETALLDAIPHY
jgi:hypothetical protein